MTFASGDHVVVILGPSATIVAHPEDVEGQAHGDTLVVRWHGVVGHLNQRLEGPRPLDLLEFFPLDTSPTPRDS